MAGEPRVRTPNLKVYSRLVTIGTYLAAIFVALVTTELLVACSGGRDTTETTIAARPRATMTDAGCTYDGATTPARGVTIDVRNGSTSDGDFALGRMTAGATRGELEAWLQKLRRHLPSPRWSKGMLKAPYQENVGTSVVGGALSEIPTYGLPAGRYVLLCFQGRGANTLVALYAATILRIGT